MDGNLFPLNKHVCNLFLLVFITCSSCETHWVESLLSLSSSGHDFNTASVSFAQWATSWSLWSVILSQLCLATQMRSEMFSLQPDAHFKLCLALSWVQMLMWVGSWPQGTVMDEPVVYFERELPLCACRSTEAWRPQWLGVLRWEESLHRSGNRGPGEFCVVLRTQPKGTSSASCLGFFQTDKDEELLNRHQDTRWFTDASSGYCCFVPLQWIFVVTITFHLGPHD